MIRLVVACVLIAFVTAFIPLANRGSSTGCGSTTHRRSGRHVYAAFETALAMAQAPFKRPRRQNAPGNIYVDER